MAEIMQAYVGQPRILEQGFEVTVDHVLGVKRRAFARGEHEPSIFVRRGPQL
jgi:hypothetical protein